MSITVPNGWPDGYRHHGVVACDAAHSATNRIAALRELGLGLHIDLIDYSIAREILSFFLSLIVDVGQSETIQVEALKVLGTSLECDLLAQLLRNEVLSICARLVAQGKEFIANEALIVLRPTIRLQARRATPICNQANMDLVAESEAIIAQRLKKGKFKGDGKPFERWCYRVLINEAISRFRQLQTDALGHRGPAGPEPVAPNPAIEVDQSDLLTAPFLPSDFTKIEEMKDPANRLIALCEPHLWRKVADNDPQKWDQWVASADGSLPFPPMHFADLHRQHLRMECLATALGLTAGAVKKRWFRDCIPVLSQLIFIRSLRDERNGEI